MLTVSRNRKWLLALVFLAFGNVAIGEEVADWSITDNSNTSLFPENMAPAQVNDSARAVQGAIARADRDHNCSLVSTGSSSALSVSATRTLTAYYDGLRLCFESHTDNDGAVTLNVDSLGAANILDESGAALPAGALANQMKVEVVYDGTAFRILSPVASDTPDEILTTQGDLIRGDSSGNGERLALGTPDQVLTVTGGQAAWANLPVASTTVSGTQENADQADMESLASTRTVTPDQVVQSPFAAKGFVRFVVSGSAIASFAGQNVATVAYDSLGDFTVDWTTDFSAATYTCTLAVENSAFTTYRVSAITAGGLSIKTVNSGGTDADPAAVNVICFGDR